MAQIGDSVLLLFFQVMFEDVRFYPILNFGLFLAALLKMSVFYPTRNFRQFWADPLFSAVRSTLLAEEEAQNVEILPHPKFWPFLGRPLKDVWFTNVWAEGCVLT